MTIKSHEKMESRFSSWKIFYYATALLGLALSVFEIHIFRTTIIQVFIPISIILVSGIGVFFFNRSHYNKAFNINGTLFPLIQNLISWGFICGYLFLATNYYLADNEPKNFEFEIKSKNSMPGSSKGRRDERIPLVTIDYFGFEKELVFTYDDTNKIENASKVILTVKKGFLGFDILDYYDTVDN